ncbi:MULTISPECIES: phosphatase PAP2 family protein [unclassified Variovorax]|uniref:phosphatase PAP2 family protein n=1 Tax=unclassified Variovorax TaxID=663243 RepID=UPI001BD2855C|nr:MULTISPECIES: phosphatase PAP2 family protein [unclassified Variovorax]
MNLLNHQLFQWIGAGFSPNAALLWLATQLAVGTSWMMAGAVAFAAWRRPADRPYILAACLMAVCAGMLAHEIAATLKHPRPFMIGLSPPWIAHGGRGSLPSTHASVMFTVALCFLYRPQLRVFGAILAALALLTGWARVYVGVHFPLDVAAGLLLGATMAAGPALASQWLKRLQVPRPTLPA